MIHGIDDKIKNVKNILVMPKEEYHDYVSIIFLIIVVVFAIGVGVWLSIF